MRCWLGTPFAAPTSMCCTDVKDYRGGAVKALHEANARLPRAVSQAVGRALSKDPERRFGTCAEFVRELRTAAAAYTLPREEYVATRSGAGLEVAGARTALKDGLCLLPAPWWCWLSRGGSSARVMGPGRQRLRRTSPGKNRRPRLCHRPPARSSRRARRSAVRAATVQPHQANGHDGEECPGSGEAGEPEESKVQMPIPKGPATKVNDKDVVNVCLDPAQYFSDGCSPDGDSNVTRTRSPAHEVTISKGFLMGQTPATQEAYRRVVGEDPSHFKGDQASGGAGQLE